MIAVTDSLLRLVCLLLVTCFDKWISSNFFFGGGGCISHCIGHVKFTGEMTNN